MLSHNESVILFGLIWGCAMTVYLLVKKFAGKGKEGSSLLPSTEPKSYGPICPHDKLECNPNIFGFGEMDGYLSCYNCDRGNNGVRATGGMPGMEKAYKAAKKVILVTGRRGCL